MKKRLLAVFLSLLLLTGCGAESARSIDLQKGIQQNWEEESSQTEEEPSLGSIARHAVSEAVERSEGSQYESEMYDDLNSMLGLLTEVLTEEEYRTLAEEFLPVWEARQERIANGKDTMSRSEEKLLYDFSLMLDEDYTDKVYDIIYEDVLYSAGAEESEYGSSGDIGEFFDYDWSEPEEHDLLDFYVNEDGTLGDYDTYRDWEEYGYSLEELEALWDQVGDMLPEGALDVFSWYSPFTDGEGYTLAYVYFDTDDPENVEFGLALDPEDIGDEVEFQMTIIHEYFHYISLNMDECEYDTDGDGTTYSEDWFTTKTDSYLNQFYQTFWTPILKDEVLANPQTNGFYARHYYDFCTDYSMTDPAEDSAESFSYYVLGSSDWYDDPELDVWEQKIVWFDQFEELHAFREAVQLALYGEVT